jgi:hypothetical protein
MGDLFNWFIDIPMGVFSLFWSLLFWFILISLASIFVKEVMNISLNRSWEDIKEFFWSKKWDIKLWWQRFRSK